MLRTRIPTPADIKMAQKADALMLWMSLHPYPFQRVSPSKRDDDIYEVFKANGIPWPCTDFYPSMEDAVSDDLERRASFQDILKFQRCAINTTSMSFCSSHFSLS
jgi:hypothetical protein